MPEYPDVQVYLKRIEALAAGQPLKRLRIQNPFLLRTAVPPVQALEGKTLLAMSPMGKRLVFELSDGFFMVLHLMVAGRLLWRKADAKIPGKIGLAAFDFESGSLILTEAGTKKRASLHIVRGTDALNDLNPGGLNVFDLSLDQFTARLTLENHTLKRSLTNPKLFSGMGNAYSDEILHHARLSPVLLSQKLEKVQITRLYESIKIVLRLWEDKLLAEAGDGFPEKVTAFRNDMAVHGKFGQPCPVCGSKIQRIRYANNETNYCPDCQTGGKVLADRALSRLLK